jgi:TonB-linked SusC/RagA family outer membrane protein
MRKFVLTLPMLLLFCALAFGQSRPITGIVRDEKGDPVAFATVTIAGTTTATQADANGKFSINASKGATLVITAVNFNEQKVSVSDRSSYDVRMTTGQKTMDEVIVTAGGIKARRKEIGTANTVVRAESLTAGKAVNVAGGLQGKVAGMNISGTSGGVNPNFRVVLRGQRSLTGNNQALIVLDNVVVPNEILSNLNPDDVEDVVVLNGAGAAALYGSQASNGALIVTTKKGKKGLTSITLNQTTTVEQVAFFPKIQTKFGSGGSSYGYDINGNPAYSYLENQSYGPAFDGVKRPLGPPLEDGRQDSAIYQFNDGHNKFWEKGITNQSDISLSTGDDKSTFYLSGQFADVKGTTPGDKYNRANLRLNGTRKIGEKLNVIYTTAYTQNRYDITTQTANMYDNMLNMPSNVDITKYKNWRTDPFANPNGFYNPWYLNPYFTADNWRSKQRNDFLTGNIELRFSPIQGLDLVARQGISTKNYSNKNTIGAFTYTQYAKSTPSSSKSDIFSSVNDGSAFQTKLLSDLFAQYMKNAGSFSINLIGGGQWTQNQAKYMSSIANGLVVPDLYNVGNGVGTPIISESNFMTRQIGAYGDLRIGYKGFLYLHATGRNDWVSILAPKNRSFFYPSVDLSFIASDALGILKESNTISYLKFRAGWSKVGQVNLGNSFDYGAYYLLPTYSATAFGFPYGSLAGYTNDNILVSPDLKPEITKGYEAGFDLNLFRDRFTSNITYYSTKTDNQTVASNVSRATGFTNLRTNTGQTQSSGLEVTAHVTPVRNKDWSVTIGGNYTYLDNNVNSISASLPRLSLATYGTDGAGSYAVAGQPFPVIMGFDYKRDPLGRVIVDAITGMPSKSDTISILGSAVAKNRLSLDGSIKFRNFSFSFLFEYRGGYKVYNSMGPEMDWSGTGYRTAIYNRERFVFPNSVYMDASGKYVPNTSIMVKDGNGNAGFWTDNTANRDVTSNYVTSGDFWKLREVSLAYDLPASILNKTKVVKGVRLSVQARNLLMWMAKDNYYTDPEYSDAGNDSNGIGLTGLNQAPPSRYYGATINVKF